jgi:hypothetical protein
MSKLTIKTDGKWKNLKYAYQVPKRVLEQEFDWMYNPDEYTFLKYKGHWFTLSDFMRITPDAPAAIRKWDGASTDAVFTNVLIKISSDGEQYKIGTYSR